MNRGPVRDKTARAIAPLKTAHPRRDDVSLAFGLSIVGAAVAAGEGYTSISTEVDLVTEPELARSMAAGMRSVDAVWVRVGLHNHVQQRVELARRRRDLKPVTPESSSDV